MMGELRTNATDLNIEILGVNQIGDEPFNRLVTVGRVLPWLQDTAEQNVWNNWQVTYRDVRILDSQNQLFGVYNLTANDLANPTNYATLKQMFLEAARVIDSDQDSLPDDWEVRYFGNLAAIPSEDPDQDRSDNQQEFAFGTDPGSARSSVSIRQVVNFGAPQGAISISFRQRTGSVLKYTIETSPDLVQWTPAGPELLALQPARNLFNGSGLAEVNGVVTDAALKLPAGFLRVRALPAR
jgi:hypothetical protein